MASKKMRVASVGKVAMIELGARYLMRMEVAESIAWYDITTEGFKGIPMADSRQLEDHYLEKLEERPSKK